MAGKEQDKRQFLERLITCLQEKLQDGADCSSQPASSQKAKILCQNWLGPTVNNGSENNHSVMPTASQGGQRHQQEIPTCQENGGKEGDGSELVASELQHSDEAEVIECTLQNRGDGEPPKKKQKLTDSLDLEISAKPMEFNSS